MTFGVLKQEPGPPINLVELLLENSEPELFTFIQSKGVILLFIRGNP